MNKRQAALYSRSGPGRPAGGFTLLELLLSLTILALIVTIIFGAFRVGVRAWEKGQRDLDDRQRRRIVLDLVRRQLASLYPDDAMDGQGRRVRFAGGPKSMTFVSYLALSPGIPSRPIFVHYRVEPRADNGGETLLCHESSLVLSDDTIAERTPDPADFFELLAGVRGIGFEYLKLRTDQAESPWQDTWDPRVERGVPRAVRIRFQENEQAAPIYVIAAAKV